MEKAIKETRDEKATVDDVEVPGEVLNLLGEYGLIILAHLINNMCGSGEWPKNFTEVRMNAFKRQPTLQNAATITQISLTAHTGKAAVRVLRIRIEREIELKFNEEMSEVRNMEHRNE